MVDDIHDKRVAKLKEKAQFHAGKISECVEGMAKLFAQDPKHNEWLFLIEQLAEKKKIADKLYDDLRFMH